MYYHTYIPIDSYIELLKQVAKKQQRLSPADKQTACLARIAKFAGFQSWYSLQDNLRLASPSQMVLISDRNKIMRGLPKAIPQVFENYVFMEAHEALCNRFEQRNSVDELNAEGLEQINVYAEVLSDFEGMLPRATLINLASKLERDGVWGIEDDIMIDEFSMSDG